MSVVPRVDHVLGHGAPRGADLVVATPCGLWSRGVEPGAVFEIGSISKTFTATILASMVRDGLVTLEDPVARHLPVAPPVKGREITLEDLATHHSGLPRLPAGMALVRERADPYARFDDAGMRRAIVETEPKRAPGRKYAYSNYGFGLLGYALAYRAGTTYAELLGQHVTRPLGLSHTGLDVEPLTQGHTLLGRPAGAWDLAQLGGAGAIRSTAADMATYLAAHARGGDGPLADTHEERHRVGKLGIGLAWTIMPDGTLTHDGGTAGFRAFAAVAPATGRFVVVLSSRARSVNRLGVRLLEALPRGPSAATTPRRAR